MENKRGSGRSKASPSVSDRDPASPLAPAPSRAKGKAAGKKAALKASSAPPSPSAFSSTTLFSVPISSKGADLRLSSVASVSAVDDPPAEPLVPQLAEAAVPPLPSPPDPPDPPPSVAGPSFSPLLSLFFPPLVSALLSPEEELIFVQRIKCSVLPLAFPVKVVVASLLLSNGFSRLFSKSFDPDIIAAVCDLGMQRPVLTGLEDLLSSLDDKILRPSMPAVNAAPPGSPSPVLSLPSTCEFDSAMVAPLVDPPLAASADASKTSEGILGIAQSLSPTTLSPALDVTVPACASTSLVARQPAVEAGTLCTPSLSFSSAFQHDAHLAAEASSSLLGLPPPLLKLSPSPTIGISATTDFPALGAMHATSTQRAFEPSQPPPPASFRSRASKAVPTIKNSTTSPPSLGQRYSLLLLRITLCLSPLRVTVVFYSPHLHSVKPLRNGVTCLLVSSAERDLPCLPLKSTSPESGLASSLPFAWYPLGPQSFNLTQVKLLRESSFGRLPPFMGTCSY